MTIRDNALQERVITLLHFGRFAGRTFQMYARLCNNNLCGLREQQQNGRTGIVEISYGYGCLVFLCLLWSCGT